MEKTAKPIPNAKIDLQVLVERPGLRIFNKPAGQPVNTGKGHETDALINGITARWPEELIALGPGKRWGIIHRLDSETSGPVLIARTPAAFDSLLKLFHRKEVEKRYIAILHGALEPAAGIIDAPLVEKPLRQSWRGWKMRMAVGPHGVAAITHYRTLAISGKGPDQYSLVEFRLDTGRRHQIRAHVFARKCAVAGDSLYNLDTPERSAARKKLGRHALHAHLLAFADLENGERLIARAPIPDEILSFSAQVGLGYDIMKLVPDEFPLQQQDASATENPADNRQPQ